MSSPCVGVFDFGVDEWRCLKALINRDVKFLLVGGYAVRYHGHLRPAKDVDVWASNDEENSQRLCAAIEDLIGPNPKVTVDRTVGRKLQISLDDLGWAFEIVTEVTGLSFDQAFERRITIEHDALPIPVVSRFDLIQMKRLAGRMSDLQDLRFLNPEGNTDV